MLYIYSMFLSSCPLQQVVDKPLPSPPLPPFPPELPKLQSRVSIQKFFAGGGGGGGGRRGEGVGGGAKGRKGFIILMLWAWVTNSWKGCG